MSVNHFPFNNIVIDNEFIAAVNSIDKTATLNDSDIIFHPFEINDTFLHYAK